MNKESVAFASIVGGEDKVKRFFDEVWQEQCKVFHTPLRGCKQLSQDSQALDEAWNEEKAKIDPFQELIHHGWDALVGLMDAQPSRGEAGAPLFFKNRYSLVGDDRVCYGDSSFAAFLDGCSIVINHADRQSPWIASLCEDLQKSFPHAYANTYWTPPQSQAVPAHADDRDVLIIQVVGKKRWKVYKHVPVKYPYSNEQVGKDGLKVPEAVLTGGTVVNSILEPGDVLYMPRGFVHEAFSTDATSSFHVTIALATHDWTFAGAVASISRRAVMDQIEFCKALPRTFGLESSLMDVSKEDKALVERQLQEAMGRIQAQLTSEAIHCELQRKLVHHNENAREARTAAVVTSKVKEVVANPIPVGKQAATKVFWASSIRAATDQEKERVVLKNKQGPRGLNVRPECYESLINLLQEIKESERSFVVGNLLEEANNCLSTSNPFLCDATILCFVRRCVELGAMALVPKINVEDETNT